ncbi:hypothetical protein RD792_017823, partial [Penstemon davidsonii]
KHQDFKSMVPFLGLDEKKRMVLFPLLFLHEEAPYPDNPTSFVYASAEIEFPVKKWIHVGCEVLQDLVRLHIDGEIVGEKPLTCSFLNKSRDALKEVYLACPDETEDKLRGFVHGLDVLFPPSAVKNHFVKDPPVRLSIEHSSTSEIEEDTDGVWSIVGGKASCRRIFSLDVTLSDAFGSPVSKEYEVVASLLYADNKAPVEYASDAEPPLLVSYDGIEYASHDISSKLISGRASFKLKISQLSSKCDNRLFQIRFDIPELGRYPFLETLSHPIHCVSRNRNSRTAPVTCRKSSNTTNRTYYVNGCEAKPSPSSKRIKLPNIGSDSHAWTSNKENTNGMSQYGGGAENNNSSSTSNSSEATHSDPKSILNVSCQISDSIIFKYCLGCPSERCYLLKEIAISAGEEQIANFADQVSLFSGCFHHRHQIKIAKRLVEDGIQAWTSISDQKNHVLWQNMASSLNEQFATIACCSRSLTDQDLECLRRIGGCKDIVHQENFERMWCWLYPVALTLSQSSVKSMWDSVSPIWIEGFITKEEAESALALKSDVGLYSVKDPGTFVLRFPTSRSWPHPDAGNLVVTYVGIDYTIHHRLLSTHHSINSVKPLQDMLFEEPELTRLGRMTRNQ